MSDAQFPDNTAGSTDVPSENRRPNADVPLGNVTVWLQTLNSIAKSEADAESQWYAQGKIRRYRKGTDTYNDMVTDFMASEQDVLVSRLVENQVALGSWHFEAFDKFTDPVKPERDPSQDETAYTELCVSWEAEVEKVNKQRISYVEGQVKKFEKTVTGWSVRLRAEKVAEASINAMFLNHYNTRHTTETLWRATRCADDHRKRHYESVDVVEELDDEIRAVLVAEYRKFDSVVSTDVPT